MIVNDICSLSDFQRKTREHLDRLRGTEKPAVPTVNGRAEVVVQDAAACQALLDLADQAEAIVGTQRELRPFERGESRPADEVFDAQTGGWRRSECVPYAPRCEPNP